MYKIYVSKLTGLWALQSKLWKVMRIIILLILAGVFKVQGNTYAQKITLNEKNETLVTVLQKIGAQSGYDFVYGNTTIKNAKPINISVSNEEFENVLKKVFDGQRFTYTIRNKTVVLYDQPKGFFETIGDYFKAIRLTGKVLDQNNQPLPGVNVQVKGSGTLTSTDQNGNYSITVPDENAVLVFSYIGFDTREIKVGKQTKIDVTLQMTTNKLEETVIIAYGTQKKTDVTGSLATISGDAIKDLPSTINVEQALQGRAAGVMVIQESGQPGAATRVRIRGASSLLGSNQPLYVVDGVPVVAEGNIPANGNALNTELINQGLSSPLNNLNPADIESMTILKDASATAIYGSRAANGVVIITTKKGSAKTGPSYTFNTTISLQEAQTQNVLNAAQFREIWTEAANNSTSTALQVQQIKNGTYFRDADTDWEKEVSPESALSRNINVAASGATDKANYYVSFGTMNQDGTFVNSDFKRYNALVNLDIAASKNIKFGTSLNLSSSNQTSPDANLLTRIYNFRPDLPVYNPDGTFTFSEGLSSENPVALSKANNRNTTAQVFGSIYGEATIAKDFKLRSVLSVNYNNGALRNFYPSQTVRGGWGRATGDGSGYGQQSSTQYLSHLWENTLNYNKVFGGDHAVDAVFGASWQGDNTEFISASGMGFPQDDILNNLSSASSNFIIQGGKTQSGLASFFGRANYAYKGKYMLSLSARTDGSSKFAKENKWAFFPTISGAWRLSEENFLKGVNFLNELKIRASIGLTGQQNFGPYQWRTLFEADQYGGLPAVIQTQLGNNRLKWELTTQTDVGLDFELFKGRLGGTLDYYVKDTKDLLFTVVLPGSSGFASTIANLGRSQNKGFEITLNGDIIKAKDFQWNLSVNASFNRNKLVSLNSDFFNPATGNISPPSTGYNLRIGAPFGLIYGRVADGLIQTQAELDALNAGSSTGVYQNANTRPGDIKFRDLNGDGRITSDDQTVIGNALPDVMGGFTNTFRYKGLSLIALFTYSQGNDLRWSTLSANVNYAAVASGENKMDLAYNRWRPDAPSNIPRAVYGDPNQNALISSYYVYDGSFIRLKNVTLAYALPKTWLAKTGFIKSLEVNATGTNLFTITNYPGPNPETSNLFNNDLSAGLDSSRFPIAKVYTFGLRAAF
ncbi:MAG: TonB-dependent receptor [Pedobacter sp.]|uniref:TonB-dependent receptor n=1 Tax=Pedobacter sp. TaxID=1411316 RepID=UPI002806A67E|nr:TonB-dependent receptor [Pedobacter sp.]MDQ8006216.1 TonB-dependent receptor [Pedobacter sp.]